MKLNYKYSIFFKCFPRAVEKKCMISSGRKRNREWFMSEIARQRTFPENKRKLGT